MSCAEKSINAMCPTASEPWQGVRCDVAPQGIRRVTCVQCGVYVVTADEFAGMLAAETTDPVMFDMFVAMCRGTGETLEQYVAREFPELSPIERDEMRWRMCIERRAIARGIFGRFGDNATAIHVNA